MSRTISIPNEWKSYLSEMDEFHYNSYAQEVIFGAGSLEQLGQAIGRLGRERLILCTNHSMKVGGHIDSVQAVLDERLVVVLAQVHPDVRGV